MNVLTVATDDTKTRLRPHTSRLPLQLVAASAAHRGRTLSAASRTGRGLVSAVKWDSKND